MKRVAFVFAIAAVAEVVAFAGWVGPDADNLDLVGLYLWRVALMVGLLVAAWAALKATREPWKQAAFVLCAAGGVLLLVSRFEASLCGAECGGALLDLVGPSALVAGFVGAAYLRGRAASAGLAIAGLGHLGLLVDGGDDWLTGVGASNPGMVMAALAIVLGAWLMATDSERASERARERLRGGISPSATPRRLAQRLWTRMPLPPPR